MQLLQDILNKVSLLEVTGLTSLEVGSVTMDSRQVQANAVFVAVRGVNVDGHQFIAKAIEKGARIIVCEEIDGDKVPDITYVVVKNSAIALGEIAANFYGNPSKDLVLVGVTGTNGKTTCATLLFNLFKQLGYSVGLLSTVENKIDDQVIPSTHTTPDAVSLNALLARMKAYGCTHVFMEVSSHSIHQHRIAGLDFNGAVFTNISHDHLDYHKTFDEYIKAKKLFFDGLTKNAFALVNGDDKRANVMLQNTVASKNFYALKTMAEFKGKIIANTLHGLELDVNNQPVWFRLIGEFNAYNLLAVYGVAMLLGEDEQEVLIQMSTLFTANGRFEQFISAHQTIGIVDYAHTPDALENVLKTINELRDGNAQIITVVGCGGDRDKAKRPIMADIACKLSDRVILTSDNPRSEKPEDILADMQAGVSPTNFRKTTVMADRREAIKLACSFADPQDVILIAGKGHETYQEINGVKHHFDDKEELKNMFELLNM